MKAKWSPLYCGISHLGELSDARRATIEVYSNHVELNKWFRGCGFNPIEEVYPTEAAARKAGEQWVGTGGGSK